MGYQRNIRDYLLFFFFHDYFVQGQKAYVYPFNQEKILSTDFNCALDLSKTLLSRPFIVHIVLKMFDERKSKTSTEKLSLLPQKRLTIAYS